MLDTLIAEYNQAIFDTDRDRALAVVREALEQGVSPEAVVFEVVLPAMDQMVKSVSEHLDANLAQHFLTAQIAEVVTSELIPKFRQLPGTIGRVVIGTAWGDFHTLGKRTVIGCLKARRIEVIDLGVNVPAERFVDGAINHHATIIAVSALMVHTATGENGCRRVRQLLQERRLEHATKIIVGGAPFRFHPQLYATVGADTWAPDAITAGKVVENMLQEVRP